MLGAVFCCIVKGMGVYDDDIATALELITEFGQSVQWQKRAPDTGGSNPWNPNQGAIPAAFPVNMIFLSPKTGAKYLQLMNGTEVPIRSQAALMAGGLPFTPELNDTITRNGTSISVNRIDLLAPNGEDVLYYVEVAA